MKAPRVMTAASHAASLVIEESVFNRRPEYPNRYATIPPNG